MEFKALNINKRYGFKTIIEDFSYTFKSGFYLITGKNGSGKSTLIKILAKLIYPSNDLYELSNDKICYINERVELSEASVKFYLKMIQEINNIDVNLQELINKWGIPNKPMSSLSKGNRQKVALVSSYLTDANIYLYDEPTDSLDHNSIVKFTEIIRYLVDNEKIVIVATHEPLYFKDLKYEEINLDETNPC